MPRTTGAKTKSASTPKKAPAKPTTKGPSVYSQLSKSLNLPERDDPDLLFQTCVDRFNEVLDVDKWGFAPKVVKERIVKVQGSSSKAHELCMAVGIWVGHKENIRAATAGSIGGMYAQAAEIATRDAFIAAAKLWGVGKELVSKREFEDEWQIVEDEHIGPDHPEPADPNDFGEYNPNAFPDKDIGETFSGEDQAPRSTDLIKRYSQPAPTPIPQPQSQENPYLEPEYNPYPDQPPLAVVPTAEPQAPADSLSAQLAEEDGAPPEAPTPRQRPKRHHPKAPDPVAPATDEQYREIAKLMKALNTGATEYRNFVASQPNQARAGAVIQNLRQRAKFANIPGGADALGGGMGL